MERIVAAKLDPDAPAGRLPAASQWAMAPAASFCADWRGENPDPQRETSVRMLWSRDRLYVRFRCRYRVIYAYDGRDCRRDQLWLRDVAEIFLQPGGGETAGYKEFEISPHGHWLDLDIFPGGKAPLGWDIRTRVALDPADRCWTAEMAIPMDLLAPGFEPKRIWMVNLFRIEGPEPHRFYSAWRPTYTAKPNFHVPERFGELHFSGRV